MSNVVCFYRIMKVLKLRLILNNKCEMYVCVFNILSTLFVVCQPALKQH